MPKKKSAAKQKAKLNYWPILEEKRKAYETLIPENIILPSKSSSLLKLFDRQYEAGIAYIDCYEDMGKAKTGGPGTYAESDYIKRITLTVDFLCCAVNYFGYLHAAISKDTLIDTPENRDKLNAIEKKIGELAKLLDNNMGALYKRNEKLKFSNKRFRIIMSEKADDLERQLILRLYQHQFCIHVYNLWSMVLHGNISDDMSDLDRAYEISHVLQSIKLTKEASYIQLHGALRENLIYAIITLLLKKDKQDVISQIIEKEIELRIDNKEALNYFLTKVIGAVYWRFLEDGKVRKVVGLLSNLPQTKNDSRVNFMAALCTLSSRSVFLKTIIRAQLELTKDNPLPLEDFLKKTKDTLSVCFLMGKDIENAANVLASFSHTKDTIKLRFMRVILNIQKTPKLHLDSSLLLDDKEINNIVSGLVKTKSCCEAVLISSWIWIVLRHLDSLDKLALASPPLEKEEEPSSNSFSFHMSKALEIIANIYRYSKNPIPETLDSLLTSISNNLQHRQEKRNSAPRETLASNKKVSDIINDIKAASLLEKESKNPASTESTISETNDVSRKILAKDEKISEMINGINAAVLFGKRSRNPAPTESTLSEGCIRSISDASHLTEGDIPKFYKTDEKMNLTSDYLVALAQPDLHDRNNALTELIRKISSRLEQGSQNLTSDYLVALAQPDLYDRNNTLIELLSKIVSCLKQGSQSEMEKEEKYILEKLGLLNLHAKCLYKCAEMAYSSAKDTGNADDIFRAQECLEHLAKAQEEATELVEILKKAKRIYVHSKQAWCIRESEHLLALIDKMVTRDIQAKKESDDWKADQLAKGKAIPCKKQPRSPIQLERDKTKERAQKFIDSSLSQSLDTLFARLDHCGSKVMKSETLLAPTVPLCPVA